MMEEMGGELANVIKDFLSAVDVEALRLVRGIGKHIVTISHGRFSVGLCRARDPAQASQTNRDWL